MTTNNNKKKSEPIRFMTKKDILGLLEYEKLTGYEFNGMPNEALLGSITDEARLPVGGAMIHNGVEMRAFISVGDGMEAPVDMPFKTFFSLPAFDKTKHEVVDLALPDGIPTDPPRKGINVEYNVPTALLERLLAANEVEVCGSNGNAEGFSADELLEKQDVVAYPIIDAWLSGIDQVNFVTGDLLANQIVESQLSIEDFFALPSRIVVWVGWDKISMDEAKAA